MSELEHPQPQFRRKNWQSLDGQWRFMFDDQNLGTEKNWASGLPKDAQTIIVPYAYETEQSGIHDEVSHRYVWYQREIEYQKDRKLTSTILNFGGIDYISTIYLNNEQVGTHQGGYTRFAFDITKYLHEGSNQLVIKVEDNNDTTQPRGKQRWRKENYECWYVQTTGIWKSVWLEKIPGNQRISNFKVTPSMDLKTIDIELETKTSAVNNYLANEVRAVIRYQGQVINSVQSPLTSTGCQFEMSVEQRDEPFPWSIKAWTPEQPNLYDLELTLINKVEIEDQVQTYFGMRRIDIKGQEILLSGHRLYQKLVLHQNYWPKSGLTPTGISEITNDIHLIKAMGYNGIRLHQSIADPRLLFLADKLGLLVWSEMAATYQFNNRAMSNYSQEWTDIVKQNYNHPAIITWVPFNESWGIGSVETDEKQQSFVNSIYYLTKAYDNMRPVITNDGWEHTISDILTLHDYELSGEKFLARYQDFTKLTSDDYQPNNDRFAFANHYHYQGQPILVTEFGGISFKQDHGWGYGMQAESEVDFFKRFATIHQAIKKIPFIQGYCYTQLTDVQQETNGLLTIDRKPKVSIQRVKEINDQD
ncbi:glycoside hydrolase family 2 protein [Lapidilactobacillus gannanensis]|uniref:Glycoside hydrolase family 2 protein n=1 Tax=Lapidilactobacillus gannanensis TaxID=2486002 RepID=A0ABW4BJD4_9LACO|nr:sugar-binding domain-containing protein [Lapidilactobacillus gannanensis]